MACLKMPKYYPPLIIFAKHSFPDELYFEILFVYHGLPRKLCR